MTKRRIAMTASAAVLALLLSGPAPAETLQEALAKAYRTNPTLTGARAGQRANDENVPIERSEGLPDIGGVGSYTENVKRSENSFNSPRRLVQGGVTLTVPIYRGGGVANRVKAAKARVLAGQADLRGTEASVFSSVVAAYMDVIRDGAIVGLNQANVRALDVNLEATRDRFEVGDLTRTDIAQSESRLAVARSDLRAAEAQLISSRENYIRLVGNPPGDLQPPPPLPNLPASPEQAVSVAIDNNPDIAAAKKAREAATYDVRVARSSRLPTISATADGGYVDYLGSLDSGPTASQSETTAAAGVTATIPLFQGGGPGALVRQAQARESQSIEQWIEVERGVVAQARAAFASWQAANSVITSSQVAVDATRLSLEGVRAENTVGTRTILDILNAEQEYLNAQVQLVSARRDAYVAGFTLLAAMGRGEAGDLGLDGGALYDPIANYERVKGRIWDWDEDPTPRAESTSTVDTPAQNSIVGPLNSN
ncbi:TolC family outer membrane protein [Rhizorhapis suberifaciens]|uniref:Outer membrane protein n=1 Tax=Rhizorhapis suberifaciens TaxID=13656 RepID=A0A840HXV9_9SPHN|nr:TolC family outer membrane protein [Rhizorhapis suberifaciens]MBB4642399.1 outer membrane protein [Rhizorhapis suberifaciens]